MAIPVGVAEAAVPQLRIAPLRYDQHLELGSAKTGMVEVSNPTGSPVQLAFQVQAFRQVNDQGELEFYDDERLAAAITPALPEFELGPREAVRVKFTIDPNKLGPGGTYGAVFLRTVQAGAAPGQIVTSARVGTLLILDVGGSGTKSGDITAVEAPAFSWGTEVVPITTWYKNTGSGGQALAFAPALELAPGWGSQPRRVKGAFVFPGRQRQSTVELKMPNQLGIVPVTVRDQSGGSTAVTRWLVVVTGIWTWLLPGLVVALMILLQQVLQHRRRRQRSPQGTGKLELEQPAQPTKMVARPARLMMDGVRRVRPVKTSWWRRWQRWWRRLLKK